MNKFKRFLARAAPRNLEQMNSQLLLFNVYLTQFILMCIALFFVYLQKQQLSDLIRFDNPALILGYGVAFAIAVLAFDLLIAQWMPEEVIDDGGLNEMLFRTLPLSQIIVLCAFVSIAEELLFRGVVQYVFGVYWTSILFAAIHFRYLRHWIMTGLVFCISYGLGWIYDESGTLLTPILAHFLIDVVLACTIRYREKNKEAL